MLIQMRQVTGLITALASKIGIERSINTTDGLTGGGDLSADRTFGLSGINLFLHNMNAGGMLARTGNASTPIAARTISGTAGQIAFADGDGVLGNPTARLVTSGVQAGTNYNRFAVDQFGRVTTAEAINYVVDDENYFKGTLNAKPLLYSGMGSAPPVLGTTRSAGLRVAFRNSTGPTVADLGIGADTAGLWVGLETGTAAATLKFYGGTSLIATLTGAGDLTIAGALSAATKSFLIDHPNKPGWKLRHGSLEGPEHAVYDRGEIEEFADDNGDLWIYLPDYWATFVEHVTVHLTPMNQWRYWLGEVRGNKVSVGTDAPPGETGHFSYLAIARRKDAPLQVESPA